MKKNLSVFVIFLFFLINGCSKPPIPSAPYSEPPKALLKKTQKLLPQPTVSTVLRTKVILPEYKNPRDGSEMILIPQGPFSFFVGKRKGAGQLKQIELGTFYIDKWEITQEQFGFFLKSQPLGMKPASEWNCPKCPISHISFGMASRYCQWAGKRLPSELEWSKAAQGKEAKPWPWGGNYEPQRANFLKKNDGYPRISPAGSFPSGASFYGVHDMSGNVWEWVTPPYLSTSEAEKEIGPGFALLKGGSWRNLPGRIDLLYRHVVNKDLALENFGFRCTKSG